MAGEAITDLSDLVAQTTDGTEEQINWFKKALVGGAAPGTLVSGRMVSLWQYDGSPGGASTTAPTTAVVCDNATAGSLQQLDPATGAKKRLLSVVVAALNIGTFIVYDRLVQHGGMSGTTTTAQTTNFVGAGTTTPALTRYTSGVGVEAWIEIYTQIGTTGTTATIQYTDTTPTGANTSPAFTIGGTGYREAQRLLRVPLISGDRGVTLVENVDLVATTGTAGDLGVTLAKPLVAGLPLPVAGRGEVYSFIQQVAGGPLDLGTNSDACIAFAWFPNSTTAPELFGTCYFMEK